MNQHLPTLLLMCAAVTAQWLDATAVCAASPRKLFADTVPLPTDPDTPWHAKIQAQRAEASHQHAHRHDPGSGVADPVSGVADPVSGVADPVSGVADPLAWYSANFAGLGKPKWEIIHQDITVDLKVAASELKTEIDVKIRAHQPVDSLSLLTTGVSALKVTQLDGSPLKVTATNLSGYTQFTIDLAKPLTPEVDWVFHLSSTAKLACNPQGIGLYPCGLGPTYQWVTFHRYYLTASAVHSPFTSTLHVIADANKVAVAPGEPVGNEKLADGRKVWHFNQIERTDNAGFAIADYVAALGKLPGDKPLRVYTTAKYASYAKNIVGLAEKVIASFSKDFVPFAWPGLSIMQLENNFGGGYAPLSGIFMYRDVFGATPDTGYWSAAVELTAHEIGHQWWGNLVEPATSGDVALSESLAEFSSCLYTETALDSRAQIIRDHLSYLYQVPASEDMAVGAQGVYSSPSYVEIVYHKGAAVFDMLRNELGTDQLLATLKQYATTYNRDYATLDDLRYEALQVTGKDLNWYWDQWFEKKGHIKADVAGRLVDKDGVITVRLRVNQQVGKPFRFTLPVTIDFADGKSKTELVEINPKGDTAVIVDIAVQAVPIRVRLDIQRRVLRKFATGTPGDFNLSGFVDGADLVEMALRYGRAMRIKGKNGQEYFFTDLSWNELYDLNPDNRIDMDDVGALEQWVGTVAEEF